MSQPLGYTLYYLRLLKYIVFPFICYIIIPIVGNNYCLVCMSLTWALTMLYNVVKQFRKIHSVFVLYFPTLSSKWNEKRQFAIFLFLGCDKVQTLTLSAMLMIFKAFDSDVFNKDSDIRIIMIVIWNPIYSQYKYQHLKQNLSCVVLFIDIVYK